MSDDLVVGRITFLDARAAEIVRLESALEAKDAEIERLKSGWHDCISDLTAAQKRAEQAERALAEQGSSNSKVAGSNPAERASSSPQKREG